MRGYSQNTRENAQKISATSNLGEGKVFTWRSPDPPQPSFLQTPQKTCELAETNFWILTIFQDLYKFQNFCWISEFWPIQDISAESGQEGQNQAGPIWAVLQYLQCFCDQLSFVIWSAMFIVLSCLCFCVCVHFVFVTNCRLSFGRHCTLCQRDNGTERSPASSN